MDAKMHHEQIIKNLSQDGISITDFFPLVSGFNLAQPARLGFTPHHLVKDVASVFASSLQNNLSSRPWMLL